MVENVSAFTKAGSIPARQQNENTDPRLWDLFFDAAPHLEYISPSFSSSALKQHLLKRHSTLSDICEVIRVPPSPILGTVSET